MFSIKTQDYLLFQKKLVKDLNFLEQKVFLFEKEHNVYKGFNNYKRKIEWLNIRLLLQENYSKKSQILYTDTGKPYLNTGEKISISHNKNYVSLIISKNKQVAVDTEIISQRIKKLSSKFVNKTELNFKNLFNSEEEFLTLIWSAKEVLVKLTDDKSYIFDTELLVNDINIESETINILVRNKDTFLLNYYIQNGNVLVWAVN